MTRDETVARFLECEGKREEARAAALTDGKSEDEADDIGHEAAKAHWNAWAEALLAERSAMEVDGRWDAGKKDWGSRVATDFSFCLFLNKGKVSEKKEADLRVAIEKETAEAERDVKSIPVETAGLRFDGFVFPGHASFNSAALLGPAWFHRTAFLDDASFESATFHCSALFGSATFQGGARFESASFLNGARFIGSTFQMGARFNSATFQGSAQFECCTTNFNGGTQFNNAFFQGGARFAPRLPQRLRRARWRQRLLAPHVWLPLRHRTLCRTEPRAHRAERRLDRERHPEADLGRADFPVRPCAAQYAEGEVTSHRHGTSRYRSL